MKIKAYFLLSKPSILFLVITTGVSVAVIHPDANLTKILLIILGLFFVGAGANAFNQYFERDKDALMERTKLKRPLANQSLNSKEALVFSICMSMAGLIHFYYFFNSLAALLSLITIVFYSFFYTLVLKPRTAQNIVIGGAAGAMGPLIAWAALASNLNSILPWSLFFVIFFWTPPHFWALALFLKEDYKKVNYPMMPLLKGDEKTLELMLFYSCFMVLSSLLVLLYKPIANQFSPFDLFYSITAISLGFYFLFLVWNLIKNNSLIGQKKLFGFSIIYVFLICFILIIDGVLL